MSPSCVPGLLWCFWAIWHSSQKNIYTTNYWSPDFFKIVQLDTQWFSRLMYLHGQQGCAKSNLQFMICCRMIHFMIGHSIALHSWLTCRFHLVPTFGHSTIRWFCSNMSEMKKLTAWNYEDILQVCAATFKSNQLTHLLAVCYTHNWRTATRAP